MRKFVLLVGIVLATSSCMSNRVNLLETKALVLREVAPTELKISTSVYEDDGNLVILGRLRRNTLNVRSIPGHVDIEVLTAQGEELATIKAQFSSLPSWRRGPNPVAFRAELPGVPPLGSTVQVKYDVNKH